ncbi:complement factor H-like [Pseudophryne corroboree]|uniref:complement factor H-like n=1 Tax=Pseudophryne corroboree TaxID=495146 RepID=UPI0030812C0B
MYFLEHLFLLTAALYYTAGCPAPERIDNFSLNGELKDNYAEGESVTYSCYPGFSRVGQIKQICSGGKWVFTNPKGQCKRRSCGHPGDIPFGSFELKEGDSFVFGAVVEYSCDEGYQLVSKQNKRECTATGWTNFPPHCEVRRCPPISAKDNVKVLSTSYDDEYSVGQVVRFECTDSKLKVDGPSEIFCTAGGEWNSAPPTCVEITCDQPNIPNGRVTRQTNRDYKENDKIYFECYTGFRASRNGESTCSKMGWSPSPYCEEITCNQYQQVANGRLISEKSAYKEGDEIALQCNEGFTIQVEPTKPRVCTSNGWSPPAACISRRCEEPEVKNGKLSRSYYFPKQPGSYIYYKCNDGFKTQGREQEEYTYCTATGWDPEPKCFMDVPACSFQVFQLL